MSACSLAERLCQKIVCSDGVRTERNCSRSRALRSSPAAVTLTGACVPVWLMMSAARIDARFSTSRSSASRALLRDSNLLMRALASSNCEVSETRLCLAFAKSARVLVWVSDSMPCSVLRRSTFDWSSMIRELASVRRDSRAEASASSLAIESRASVSSVDVG